MTTTTLIIIVAVVILIIATLSIRSSRRKEKDRSGKMQVYRYTGLQPGMNKESADELERGLILIMVGWIISDLFD